MNATTDEKIPGDLMTVKEAAKLLQLRSMGVVYRWIRAGKLRAWEIAGTTVRVSEADVRALICPYVPRDPAPGPRTESQRQAASDAAVTRLRGEGWDV